MKIYVVYLRIAEYTSQRIPPVQYINTSVFSLSMAAKGSDSLTWYTTVNKTEDFRVRNMQKETKCNCKRKIKLYPIKGKQWSTNLTNTETGKKKKKEI